MEKLSDRESKLVRNIANSIGMFIDSNENVDRAEILGALSFLCSIYFVDITPAKDVHEKCKEINDFCMVLTSIAWKEIL